MKSNKNFSDRQEKNIVTNAVLYATLLKLSRVKQFLLLGNDRSTTAGVKIFRGIFPAFFDAEIFLSSSDLKGSSVPFL
jgi:hypothetical protein